MRLITLYTSLYFAEEFTSHSVSQQLYAALSGKEPLAVEETFEPGFNLRSTKQKLAVKWDADSCHIAIESILDAGECLQKTIALLETINRVAPIGACSKRELTCHWLLPMESYSFRLLERKYRGTLIAKQPIWKGVYDSSVITDIEVDDLILHHQSGAMKKRQLLDEYVAFNRKDIPKVFLFLLTSVYSDKVIKYSSEDIHKFLITAFGHCERHSRLFEDIWRNTP